MTWEIREGDCIEVMAGMDAGSVDAVVCDPPYHLSFMGRAWDHASTGSESQAMHEAWAREALRVLKPGGHLLAFGGTRTYHRLACGVEDAGFEIRDSLIWLYASGFPKSLDVGKAIDKAAGAEREVREKRTDGPSSWLIEQKLASRAEGGTGIGYADGSGKEYDVTTPATPEAKRWDGWGTALKPAHEPVVVARKPLSGTVAVNIQRFGTGALNIDGSRISTTDSLGGAETGTTAEQKGNDGWATPWMDDEDARDAHAGRVRENVQKAEALGRWPANVVLSHAEGCKRIGEKRIKPVGATARTEEHGKGQMFGRGPAAHAGYRDEDGLETVEAWECQPGCPVFELDQQSGESNEKPRVLQRNGDRQMDGWGLAGESAGVVHGGSGGASRFFFVAKASSAERNLGLPVGQRCSHPTVKPVELMRWLVRLVTPPGGLVLDPFAGSGTTGIAALREGFDFIGVEREPEYVEIARARIIGDAPLLNTA